MIIFYNKKSRQVIGYIEGRVHFDHHLKATMSSSDNEKKDIEKIIIGWTESEKGERMEHNMHLWKHQLDFEDPKNPRSPIRCKIKKDKGGKINDFTDN